MRPRVVAPLVALVAWLLATAAAAFVPPPMQGHVTDLAGKLSAQDDAYLEERLDVARTGAVEIAVLVIPSLEGEAIEDIGFATGNAWGVGRADKANGVLLVIATGDRKVRIETGKGAGGALTDLQANDIIRKKIGPRLKEERFREAIDEGSDAIIAAFRGEPIDSAPGRSSSRAGDVGQIVLIVLFLGLFTWVAIRNARRGGGGGGGYWGGGGWGGGGGGWGGGGGGSGGGGGGGYSGGGGSFGGGGSSDSY